MPKPCQEVLEAKLAKSASDLELEIGVANREQKEEFSSIPLVLEVNANRLGSVLINLEAAGVQTVSIHQPWWFDKESWFWFHLTATGMTSTELIKSSELAVEKSQDDDLPEGCQRLPIIRLAKPLSAPEDDAQSVFRTVLLDDGHQEFPRTLTVATNIAINYENGHEKHGVVVSVTGGRQTIVVTEKGKATLHTASKELEVPVIPEWPEDLSHPQWIGEVAHELTAGLFGAMTDALEYFDRRSDDDTVAVARNKTDKATALRNMLRAKQKAIFDALMQAQNQAHAQWIDGNKISLGEVLGDANLEALEALTA